MYLSNYLLFYLGVVERASKELSRRICSFAAKTRRAGGGGGSQHSSHKHERLVEQLDTDRYGKRSINHSIYDLFSIYLKGGGNVA